MLAHSSVVAVAIGFAIAAVPASAQMSKIKPIAALHGPEESTAERLNHMEAEIKTLTAQVAADEVKLKAAGDTANQAKSFAGFLNVGLSGQIKTIQGQIEGIKSEASSTGGKVNQLDANLGQLNSSLSQLNAGLDQLSTKFATHTHKFNSFKMQAHADGSITNLQYTVANTMPPNN
jgi:X-X-X-Leu-X-X-Gly heptad repeat protein